MCQIARYILCHLKLLKKFDFSFSTVLIDPKTGGILYSSHIIELFPEREGSPENWFFNDQDDHESPANKYTTKVPRSASVPPAKQLQSFVCFNDGFTKNDKIKFFFISGSMYTRNKRFYQQ